MELNQEIKHQIADLLAKPSRVKPAHAEMLASLAKAYPYYQPIYILLAKANADAENYNQLLTKAALYNSGAVVHQVVYQPQTLITDEDFNLINYPSVSFDITLEDAANKVEVKDDVSTFDDQEVFEEINEVEPITINENNVATESQTEVEPSTEQEEDIAEEEVEITENPATLTEAEKEELEIQEIDRPIAKVEAENQSWVEEEIAEQAEEVAPSEEETTETEFPQSDKEEETLEADEHEVFEEISELKHPILEEEKEELTQEEPEVYDEIAEVNHQTFSPDVSSERVEKETILAEEDLFKADEPNFGIETIEKQFDEEEEEVKEKVIEDTEAIAETKAPEVENIPLDEIPAFENPIIKEGKVDDFAFESIAATDFFAFEKSFVEDAASPTQENKSLPAEESNREGEDESVVLSKYDDDKLPYTFLWWLNKTRKEHAQIFQPYVTAKKTAVTGALQQQYVEHIFHIQTPFAVDEEVKLLETDATHQKENEIIENFIKKDPIIKALKPDQIDNENKAKKSAEDHYDLVSETLASIYIEQMLYHKAIDTYQKLSLKFPEKSRYFADLIQSLEKKI